MIERDCTVPPAHPAHRRALRVALKKTDRAIFAEFTRQKASLLDELAHALDSVSLAGRYRND